MTNLPYLAFILALPLALSCGARSPAAATVAPKEGAAAPARDGAAPSTEASMVAIAVPAAGTPPVLSSFADKGESIRIIYKHTHPDFLDAYGYDTELIRVYRGASGALERAVISESRRDAASEGLKEVEKRRLEFKRTEAGDILVSDAASRAELYLLRREGRALAASAPEERLSYSLSGTEFRIERKYGERLLLEEYSSQGGGSSRLSENGKLVSLGRYLNGWPKPRFYVERPIADPSGGEDRTAEFFYEGAAAMVRVDWIEPECEARLSGLDSISGEGEAILEAIALIDLCLGYSRRLGPLLALSILAP
jgi:hypothetical protein